MLLAFLLARLRVSAALRTFPLSCFDPRSPDIRVSHRTHHFDWPHAELIQVNREPVVTRSRGARCNANAALFASGGCASPSRVFVQQPSKPLYCLVRLADLTKCLLQDSGVAERNARGCRVGSQ